MRLSSPAFLVTTALVALTALPAVAQDWKTDYRILRFGISSSENEKDRMIRNEPMRAYLEQQLGVEVEIFTAGSFDGIIQALASGQIEMARLGSSAYAAAYTESSGNVVPTLTNLHKDGSSGYVSVLVTRCDSGIKTLADAKGKVLAFADPDSTSGYTVPYFNMVEREGIDPKTFFRATSFAGSHESAVMGVVNGNFDVGATYQNNDDNGIYQRMEEKGMIDAGLVCKIWESPEITNGPLVFNKSLPPQLIEDVTLAMERFPEADVEAYRLYTSFTEEDANPAIGFQRVDHARYQWIVDMRDWLKQHRSTN